MSNQATLMGVGGDQRIIWKCAEINDKVYSSGWEVGVDLVQSGTSTEKVIEMMERWRQYLF